MLDLDGDGVELVALDDSTAFYDINGDGYRERMAWASADDGFLAYDKDGDGTISAHDELSFMSYVEGAQTDLEGLAHFDTNDDGVLDADDAEWSRFRVWQDLDQDGESDAGELRTMAEAGITSISLTSDGVEQTVAGNTVFGEGSYTDGEGSQSFFDVALQHSGWGIREDADGNITVGSGDDAVLHIAGATTEPERRLDASVLGVAGIIGHDTADHLTAAAEGSLLAGAGRAALLSRLSFIPPASGPGKIVGYRVLTSQTPDGQISAGRVLRGAAGGCDGGIDDFGGSGQAPAVWGCGARRHGGAARRCGSSAGCRLARSGGLEG